MDEGPFRASRPADRRVAAARPEPAYRQADEPKPAQQVTPTSTRPATIHSAKDKKSLRRSKLPFVIIIAAVILGIIGWLAILGMNKGGATEIDKSKYQAVFFTNGQVYFGKLTPVSNEYMKLTDIYYLQTKSTDATDANPQQTSSDSDVQLIKLGSEIHGPEDEMILSKDQLLFYENLKTDGKVAQSIESYKRSH
jgi:hypothetical protein